MDDMQIIMNANPFRCPVCWMRIPIGHGVVLRDCIHEICRPCLTDTVHKSKAAMVKCPYNKEYTCESSLQQREVRALLPDEEAFNRYLANSLQAMDAKCPEVKLNVLHYEYTNDVPTSCQRCEVHVPSGAGVYLPSCSHSLCFQCLEKPIQQEQPVCPVIDFKTDTNCCSIIPTGVIRFLMPSDEFERYQQQQLDNLDDMELILNVIPFECPVCLIEIPAGDGVVQRDCLHEICRECLAQSIQHCNDAEVKCPYIDNDYSCESVLQQREVRAILSDETAFHRYLSTCLNVAEQRMPDTFHCLTADCKGFCVVEENEQQFPCPICKANNCVPCQVGHFI